MTGTPTNQPAPSVTGPDLELEFPSRPEFVRTARHTVAALARMLDVEDDVVDNVRLAVSETVTTAVTSAEAADRMIGLTVRAEDGRMVIEVRDPGAALRRAVEGDPTDIDTLDLPFGETLAVPIIRGLAEEVAVIPDGAGTRLRITLSLGG